MNYLCLSICLLAILCLYILNISYKRKIEKMNKKIDKVIKDIEDVRMKNYFYKDYEIDNSILTYWIEILKEK